MQLKSIRVYPTHIEIEPYIVGEYKALENMCSSEYNPATHTREPIGYRIIDQTLYIPRGIDVNYLYTISNSYPTFFNWKNLPKFERMVDRYEMKKPPRDEIQVEALDFLLSRGNYLHGAKYSQLILNLGTGLGKTYVTIAACIKAGVRSLIIVHRGTILDQWITTIKEKTNVPNKRVVVVRGSDTIKKLLKTPINYDFILIMNQTLASYKTNYGEDALKEFIEHLSCGIKVVDEAHLCFRSIIEIDMFSNIPRNFYLTATFSRGDIKEVSLYKRVFSNAIKLSRRANFDHIIYTMISFNSLPTQVQRMSVMTNHGFNSKLYSDYAFDIDPTACILSSYFYALSEALMYPGRILVVIPKIEHCEYIKELTERKYPTMDIAALHSKNKLKENQRIKEESHIIISTMGSLGTGADIADIQSIILMEPFSSWVNNIQLIGRLRKISGRFSYVYELIDEGFPDITRMLQKRFKSIKSSCKEVKFIKL